MFAQSPPLAGTWPRLVALRLRRVHLTGPGAEAVLGSAGSVAAAAGGAGEGLCEIDLGENNVAADDLAPLVLLYARRRCACRVRVDGTAVSAAAAAGLDAARSWAADGAVPPLPQSADLLAAIAAAAGRFWLLATRADCGGRSAGPAAAARASAAAAANFLALEGVAVARASRALGGGRVDGVGFGVLAREAAPSHHSGVARSEASGAGQMLGAAAEAEARVAAAAESRMAALEAELEGLVRQRERGDDAAAMAAAAAAAAAVAAGFSVEMGNGTEGTIEGLEAYDAGGEVEKVSQDER